MAIFGKVKPPEFPKGPEKDDFGPPDDVLESQPITRPAPERRSTISTTTPEVSSSATIIAEKVFIRGEIESDNDVKVLGRVEGALRLKKNLVIGPTGVLEAHVEAQNVIVSGKLTGNIRASGKVEITSTGEMIGDIQSPRIIVSEGARFKGNVDMSDASKTITSSPPPPQPQPPQPHQHAKPTTPPPPPITKKETPPHRIDTPPASK